MTKRSLAPLTTIGLLVGQLALAGAAFAQGTSSSAYADAYVRGCGLLTGTDRLACFDLLPSRISGDQGRYSWLGNTADAARKFASAPSSQQFVGTAQAAPARPFGFIDTTSPL